MKAVTLRIPDALYERVRLAAFRQRLSVNKAITEILAGALEAAEGREPDDRPE